MFSCCLVRDDGRTTIRHILEFCKLFQIRFMRDCDTGGTTVCRIFFKWRDATPWFVAPAGYEVQNCCRARGIAAAFLMNSI
jgi:hypothetical protein